MGLPILCPAPRLNPNFLSCCPQMTWFHTDCQDLMRQLRLGKAQRASPGDQRRLDRYRQRLASEFPTEKLTAMGLQVASLSQEGLGQDLWEEARVRHEEIQTLLNGPLPMPRGAQGPLSTPRSQKGSSQGPGSEWRCCFQRKVGPAPFRLTRPGPFTKSLLASGPQRGTEQKWAGGLSAPGSWSGRRG